MTEGTTLRDQGIQRTLFANDDWLERALAELPKFREAYPEFIGETLRSWLASRGIEPQDPHAWGGLISTLVKRKLVVDTGRVRKMRDPQSHARRSPVWKWR